MSLISRRAALAGFTALAGLPLTAHGGQKLRELTIWGPPAGPSITVAHAITAGYMWDIADKVTFKAWRNPDELRAGLTSGTMQAVVMPVNTAANLYNRGLRVRLVNVLTNGLLYMVATDASLSSIVALKGRTIVLPFRGDTVELTLRRLLALHGLNADTDLSLQFAGTPMEAIQLLYAGRADAALLPEPAAAAAIMRAGMVGKQVTRTMDMQQIWSAVAAQGRPLPQAGLGVSEAFLREQPGLVTALHEGLVQTTAAVNANPSHGAKDAADALGMPAPVLAAAIPYCNLVAVTAREARPSIEAAFQQIAAMDPRILGGKIPDSDFYL